MATMRWMLLISLVACVDRVEVEVQVPDAYREDVASLVLHVLEPPESEPFGCDQVALGDVLPGAVELSETWLASLDEPGGEYVRINRRGSKRLWVEGVDITGLPLVEGCAELGYVGSDRVVTVELEPTVILDLFGEGAQLHAALRDFRGAPQSDATIVWRRVEPGGLITEGAAITDDRGRTPIAVERPTRSGPSLLEFMVRWSRTGKTVFQGFAIPPVLGPVPFPNVSSSAAGRIGPDGGNAGVGVYDDCGGVAGDWGTALVSVSAAGELEVDPLVPCTRGGVPPAVAAIPVSVDRDRIVTLAPAIWRSLEVSRVGGDAVATIVSGSTSPPMLLPPKQLFDVGPCDGTSDQVLAVAAGGIVLGVYRIPTEDGATAVRVQSGPFAPIQGLVGGSGCVSDGAGGERRVVLHTFEGAHRMTVADVVGPGSCRFTDWTSPPLATPTVATTSAVERHLVYAVVKAGVGDLELHAARLDLTGGGCRPLATIIESLPSLPVAVQSGDMDGDGLLDLVAVIGSVGIGPSGLVFNERVWASLGVEHNGTRLTGTSVMLQDLLVTQLRIYDADGDGLDDVMMIANQEGTAEPVALGVLMGMPPQ